MLRALSILTLALALLAASGCGGDDDELGKAKGVPAAGANTPPAGTPGVPAGASYDVDGRGWERLSQTEMFTAATDYAEDNPAICSGVDVAAVSFYVTNSYGNDFPLDIPAADLLSEGCAADQQS